MHEEERWRRRALVVWTVIGWLLLGATALWLLMRVWSALVPFVLAVIVVFVFRWPVNKLQERGLARSWGTAVCFLGGLAALSIAGAFILPPLGDEIAGFVRRFPEYFATAVHSYQALETTYRGLSLPEPMLQALQQLQVELAAAAPGVSSAFASRAVDVGGQALALLFNTVIALVIAFWVLKDLPAIREEILVLSGPGRRDEVRLVLSEISGVLGGYLKAQIIISTVTGTLVAIGLAVFAVPYALVLGLLTGVLNIVPYLGPAIASLTAAIVAGVATQNLWLALAAVAVIFASQQVTDLFITPRVMSEQVDLHPLLVLLSLLAGGALFGAPGVLLGIPVAAVAKALFVHFFEKHMHVELGSEDGALFKASRPAPDPGRDGGADDGESE